MAPPIEARHFTGKDLKVDVRYDKDSTTPFLIKFGDTMPVVLELDWLTVHRLRDVLVKHAGGIV